MPDFILSQDQLQHIAFSLKLENAQSQWNQFSDQEKQFVVETLKKLYPKVKTPINESKWYNTLGDILGIFDPTGVVDFINGMSYINQGDYFFGFLSMVAVVPYVGDVVAKPLLGVGKSSKLFKGMNQALTLAKNGKTFEAGVALEKAGRVSPMMQKFINSSITWGGKLKSAIQNVPVIPAGFKKVLTDWIDLFVNASKKSAQAKRVAGGFASKVAFASKDDAVKMIQKMKNTVSSNTGVFKNFKASDPRWMAKNFWPGLSWSKLGLNRDLISLFRRTKFYAGLLDYIGIGNFVGPDELAAKVPNIDEKFQDYVNSPEGQNIYKQEFREPKVDVTYDPDQDSQTSSSGTSTPQPSRDLLKDLISGAFFRTPLA